MLFIDFIYLLVLTWYANQVVPSEFGTQKPWYFVFQPSYWIKSLRKSNKSASYHRVHMDDGIELASPENLKSEENLVNEASENFIEPVAANLRSQIDNRTCIDIQKLYKQFQTGDGVKIAVNKLSLQMYSGQITALLGI